MTSLPQLFLTDNTPNIQKTVGRYSKRQEKTQAVERKQCSESDSDRTQMLKLSDKEFEITMANKLRNLMGKVCKNMCRIK
jgi:hypothetical protein